MPDTESDIIMSEIVDNARASESAGHPSVPVTSLEDSPRKSKSDRGTVDQYRIRSSIWNEMYSELLVCPVDVFLHYGPFSPSDALVDLAVENLKTEKFLIMSRHQDPNKQHVQWGHKTIPKLMANGHAMSETEMAKGITKIVKAIASVNNHQVGDRLRNEFYYEDCGNRVMLSETVGGGFKSDAVLVCGEFEGGKVPLRNVGAFAEFKKPTSDSQTIRQNRLQVISAASHIMHDDPCRMFIYAFSIEGQMMSVWYFSRSHSVVSREFNWVEEPRLFVKFFVSFLFATKEELGFDPSVRRVMYGNEFRYIYQMKTPEGNRYFRTIKVIFTSRTSCITGRMTRVWKVVELDITDKQFRSLDNLETARIKNKGKTFALKDVWLDEGSTPEHVILDEIFKELGGMTEKDYLWADDEYLRPLIRAALRDFPNNLPFMSIECAAWGEGATKEHLPEAKHDPNFIPAKQFTSTPQASAQRTDKRSSQIARSSASAGNPKPSNAPKVRHYENRKYKVKRQYRLVYSTVGYPLYRAKDLSTAYNAIKDVFVALTLLYLAGWVHRDVSTGNIIVIDIGGQTQGLLSDLEYARRFDRTGPCASDPKTGTPYFMPVEIHAGAPLQPVNKLAAKNKAEFLKTFRGGSAAPASVATRKPAPSRPIHMFHHDLESLSWVDLWFAFGRVKRNPALNKFFYDLFTTGDFPHMLRVHFFEGKLPEAWKSLEPPFPEQFRSLLERISDNLYSFCMEVPPQPSKDDFVSLYNDLSPLFYFLSQCGQDYNDLVELVPLSDDDDDDDDDETPPAFEADLSKNAGNDAPSSKKQSNKGKEKAKSVKAGGSSRQPKSTVPKKRGCSPGPAKGTRRSLRLNPGS